MTACSPVVVKVQQQTVVRVEQIAPIPVKIVYGGSNGSEDIIQKITDQAIGGHRVVKATSSTNIDYANNTDLNDSTQILGLTLGAAGSGEKIIIRTWGEVTEPSWSWSPGWIWLGINGLLTQTPPQSPALFSMVIGQALSATTMRVLLLTPITL